MKFKTLILLLILKSFPGFSQGQSVEGTLIVMAVCTDGIIVGTDSRGSIRQNYIDQAYIDDRNKSVIIGRNVVSAWGRTFVSNESLMKLVSRVPNINISETPLEDLKRIGKYIFQTTSESEFKTIRKETHPMISGYVGNEAHLCWYGENWDSLYCKNTFLSNHEISETIQNEITSSSMLEATFILENLFNEMESTIIGGPLKIVLIDEETKTPRCIRNCDDLPNAPISETYQQILDGKLKFTLIPPTDTLSFFNYLQDQINRLKNSSRH